MTQTIELRNIKYLSSSCRLEKCIRNWCENTCRVGHCIHRLVYEFMIKFFYLKVLINY